MRRRTIAIGLCGLLVLVACSSDDGANADATVTSPSDSATTSAAAPASSTITSSEPATTTTVVAGPVACESDDDLAAIETLLRTGQPAYDYQPARDLAQLVEWSDVVVTGTISSVQRSDEFTTFTVTDVERLAGSGDVEQIDSMATWASGQEADPLGDPVEFEGLAFIAFLVEFDKAPGGWTPHVEGFGFACSPNTTTTASLAGLTRGTVDMSIDEIANEVRAVAAGEPGAGTFGVTRPVFDESICTAQSAQEGATTGDLTFFAQSSDEPVTVQVIAEPGTTPADPFALLLRYPADTSRREGGDPVDIGGRLVSLRVFPNGNGAATWDEPDGSTGYLRSRGLDEDDLTGIIELLVAAPLDAPYPGFDMEVGSNSAPFQLLYEGVDTHVSGFSAGSECSSVVADAPYRIVAVFGDPVFRYGAVIDRPVPLEVGVLDGTLLILDGIERDGAPSLADVIDADPDEWARLIEQPDSLFSESVQRSEPISDGGEITVLVNTLTGSGLMPSGSYTLRFFVAEGVSFVEANGSEVDFHPDAARETIEINGRPRSQASVIPQSTHGVRIADTATPEPFIVSIVVTDALGEPLQLSEPVRLVPE